MKKTLTINLGGTVYHIDEDAYVLLDNYLNNLRYYFRREEGAEEIVRDIENRIGELFDEYLRNGQQVITVENVEAVIERMGKPEQLDEETPESESSAGTRREERPRRLFRGPDDRVLGGFRTGCLFQLGSHVGTYCSYTSCHSGSWTDLGLPDCLDCDSGGPYGY